MAVTRTLTRKYEDAEGPPAIFVDRTPIVDFNDDSEATVTLDSGERSLTYEIHGSGAKLTLDLEGRPRITIPVGAKWPFVVKVPDDRTAAASRLYFVIGD